VAAGNSEGARAGGASATAGGLGATEAATQNPRQRTLIIFPTFYFGQ
jgi:hypothetical protein